MAVTDDTTAGKALSLNVTLPDSGPRTLAVGARNDGSGALPAVRVRWVASFKDAPQPDADGRRCVGEAFDLFHPRGAPDLPPGGVEWFHLPPPLLPAVLGHGAALSPEQYWLSVWSGERELCRVRGADLGGVLDALETR
jgi:hypothetical protein